MKKVILFLWFGDEKPAYINWTLDNFRKMNPGWEIRYIEYSNEQISNYKDQNDPILVKAVERNKRPHVNYIADEYRKIYLDAHKDEIVVYCDLDCFPIAPFDNFLLPENANVDKWIQNNHPQTHTAPIMFGCNWFRVGGYHELRPDIWCLCNNKAMLFHERGFLQLHKNSIMDETLIIHNAMLMNKSHIPELDKRNKDFHNMNIELGDNFCLEQFTPIEHYYSFERNRLNT